LTSPPISTAYLENCEIPAPVAVNPCDEEIVDKEIDDEGR
jgi:hypothetical protein